MENNFVGEDLYAPPDPNNVYHCSSHRPSSGFTLLMKWCLLTNQHPELFEEFSYQLIYTIPSNIYK